MPGIARELHGEPVRLVAIDDKDPATGEFRNDQYGDTPFLHSRLLKGLARYVRDNGAEVRTVEFVGGENGDGWQTELIATVVDR